MKQSPTLKPQESIGKHSAPSVCCPIFSPQRVISIEDAVRSCWCKSKAVEQRGVAAGGGQGEGGDSGSGGKELFAGKATGSDRLTQPSESQYVPAWPPAHPAVRGSLEIRRCSRPVPLLLPTSHRPRLLLLRAGVTVFNGSPTIFPVVAVYRLPPSRHHRLPS